MDKKIGFVLVGILILFSVVHVSAITGKIGNGRMILDLEVGQTLERTIRVINDNDVAVNITLFASGDLSEDVTILDENFILQPGDEKKAKFELLARKSGDYETKINVQFAPLEGESKNGVGISSTVITRIHGEGEIPKEELDGEDSKSITGKVTDLFKGDENEEGGEMDGALIALGISSVVLLGVLAGLLFLASMKKDEKVGKKRKERGDVKNAIGEK